MKYIKPDSIGALHLDENHDCVVRCMSNATGIAYDECHSRMKNAGRKDRKATVMSVWWPVYKEAGFELQSVNGTTKGAKHLASLMGLTPSSELRKKGCTIENCIKDIVNCTDNIFYNYAILIKGHIFAVVDNKIMDKGLLNKNMRVKAVFRVRKIAD